MADYCGVCGKGNGLSRCVRCSAIFCPAHKSPWYRDEFGFTWPVPNTVCEGCAPAAHAQAAKRVGPYTLIERALYQHARPAATAPAAFWKEVTAFLESAESPPVVTVRVIRRRTLRSPVAEEHTSTGWSVWSDGYEKEGQCYIYSPTDRVFRKPPWSYSHSDLWGPTEPKGQTAEEWLKTGVPFPPGNQCWIDSKAVDALRARMWASVEQQV